MSFDFCEICSNMRLYPNQHIISSINYSIYYKQCCSLSLFVIWCLVIFISLLTALHLHLTLNYCAVSLNSLHKIAYKVIVNVNIRMDQFLRQICELQKTFSFIVFELVSKLCIVRLYQQRKTFRY